jgi:hypothetical protein
LEPQRIAGFHPYVNTLSTVGAGVPVRRLFTPSSIADATVAAAAGRCHAAWPNGQGPGLARRIHDLLLLAAPSRIGREQVPGGLLQRAQVRRPTRDIGRDRKQAARVRLAAQLFLRQPGARRRDV